jgi:hypothetical protein
MRTFSQGLTTQFVMTTSESQSSTGFPIDITQSLSSSSLKSTIIEAIFRVSGNSFTSSNGAVEQLELSTYKATPPSDYMEIPVVGLPGPIFTIIHSVALCGLSTSILVSVSLLIYLCTCRRKEKARKRQQPKDSKSTGSGPGRQGAAGNRLDGSSGTKVESSLDFGEGSKGKTVPSKMAKSHVG